MGQQGELQYDSTGYSDVTGSNYAVGRNADHVAGVALEARLRAKAATEACDTVQAQAIVALKDHGFTVRQIANILNLSKSHVGRELRQAPHRSMPLPEIDRAVAQVWEDGLLKDRSRRTPRPGDRARELIIEINMLAAETSYAKADEAAAVGGLVGRAESVGRYAAKLAHDLGEGATIAPGGDAHHPGDDTGRLVIEAFRSFGPEAARRVVDGYAKGYNEQAKKLGDDLVDMDQIRNGMGWALPGVTAEEEHAILSSVRGQ